MASPSLLLPLAKVSFATCPIDTDISAPIPWTHLTGDNLFAAFEDVTSTNLDGSSEDSKRLKVLRDPEVMVMSHPRFPRLTF
jgi:hypothetical protein